ncbi:CYTH domain-containing protein [Radiobacillus sp. PE A8.2]|uniref:CYTH domain-containing protein n=1 Tax=Radiobacillus sp. PE A8.2 TaxID=3380349 RepID=UPI003890052D
MSQEIEIEFKNLLSKHEYETLAQVFGVKDQQGVVQTNHYFETNDFKLKQNKSALRIREKNNLWQLTLKEPHMEGLLETHDTLSEIEAQSWLNGDILPKPEVAKQLNQLGIDFAKLTYGGSLTTTRKETTFKNTIVVLDVSQYNGQQDYEFELEAKDREHGELIFNEIMHAHGIKIRNTPNKIERFYNAL